MVEMRDIDEVEKEEEERRKEEEVVVKRQVDIGRQRIRKRRATDGEREEIQELQDRVSDLENRLNIQDEQIRSLKERFREVEPATHQRPPLFGENSVVPATTPASTQQPPLFGVPPSATSTILSIAKPTSASAFTFGSTHQAPVFGESLNKKPAIDGDFVKPTPTSDSAFGSTKQSSMFGELPIKTASVDGSFAEPTSAPASGFGVTQHIGAQVALFGAPSSTTPAINLSSPAPTPTSGFTFGSSQQSALFGSSSSRAPEIGTSFATPASTSTSTFGFCPSPALRSDGFSFGGSSSSALPQSTSTFGYTPDKLPFGIGANPGSLFDRSPFIPESLFFDRSPFKPATSCRNQFWPYTSPTIFGVHRYHPRLSGTRIKFKQILGTDQVIKKGVLKITNTRSQCITCMKEYETESQEELRLGDYLARRQTGSWTRLFDITT